MIAIYKLDLYSFYPDRHSNKSYNQDYLNKNIENIFKEYPDLIDTFMFKDKEYYSYLFESQKDLDNFKKTDNCVAMRVSIFHLYENDMRNFLF